VMSKNGYYGDFESLAEEQVKYQKWLNNKEPDVVPCKCGKPMYEIEEMCDECKKTC